MISSQKVYVLIQNYAKTNWTWKISPHFHLMMSLKLGTEVQNDVTECE